MILNCFCPYFANYVCKLPSHILVSNKRFIAAITFQIIDFRCSTYHDLHIVSVTYLIRNLVSLSVPVSKLSRGSSLEVPFLSNIDSTE